MVHAILLCCAMLGDGGKPAEATASTRAAYETAQVKAGKSAAAHVQLALWCEAHGLTAERIKHLNEAIELDPSNVLARGLLGLVAFQGKWAKPDQAEQGTDRDPRFQAVFREYLDRRIRTPQKNADAQLRLAAWCLEKGLMDQATAHYYVVTRLDPSRDVAWIRLGYKKFRDRWYKPDELAAQKVEAESQKRADIQWKPRLERLRAAIESAPENRRLKAERQLYQITDPRAAPMIWRTFGNGPEKMQLLAVELLAQLDGPTASFLLAALAIEKPSPEVRARAARALEHRDARDVIGWLVSLLRKPYTVGLDRSNGPRTAATLSVDGEEANLRRTYQFPELDTRLVPSGVGATIVTSLRNPAIRTKPSELLAISVMSQALAVYSSQLLTNAMWQRQQQHEEMQQTIQNDIRAFDEANTRIGELNDRSLPLLESLTGQKLGTEPVEWRKWWTEELGFSFDDQSSQSKSTITQTVEQPDIPVFMPIVTINVITVSCFAAGTPVQTSSGLRKIETLAVGDRVLSQHASSGELSFQPVLATTVRGGAETFRISIEGETIVATGIHRFWKAGNGWTMARDLKRGDRLRMINGTASVQSIQPDVVQNVYNLSVAQNSDFMIGNAGILVHDVGFVQPANEPFDRQTSTSPSAK
jgi:tetratricopeptide (TPR) repeat protein